MSTTPPPLEGAPVANSFYHKAASYAVIVIPAGIVLNVLLGGIAKSVNPPALRLLLGLLPGLLMLTALPAGIVALCGIPKFGKAKLLWKGLVGVLVPVLLMAIAIPAFLKVRDSARERARQSQQGK